MDKKIIIGSRAFFQDMPEFTPKDTDTLVWVADPKGFTNYRQTSISGQHIIEWRAMPKDDLLAHAMRDKANGLEFGKFIVAEFAELVGLTIDDLKRLRDYYAEKIDANHRYQLVISEAYIDNGAFTLTDDQRETAYQAYLNERKSQAADEERDAQILAEQETEQQQRIEQEQEQDADDILKYK